MRDPNKMAGVNSRFEMSIKSTLNSFVVQMPRLIAVEVISCVYTETILLFFPVSVNSGTVSIYLRGLVNILPLLTSISKNNC